MNNQGADLEEGGGGTDASPSEIRPPADNIYLFWRGARAEKNSLFWSKFLTPGANIY